MKVLLVNGSSHKEGCTYTALNEIAKILNEHMIKTEIYQLAGEPISDCTGCKACRRNGNQGCIINDKVNDFVIKAKSASGFVFGSPVYYAHTSGRLLSFMDRVFYSSSEYLKYKPAAAVVSARRAGTTAALEPIIKHFTINQMPVVSSNYWNMVHGNTPEEVKQDLEGLQIMRVLAHNMAWLLKCIEAGENAGIKYPQQEDKISTNFIR